MNMDQIIKSSWKTFVRLRPVPLDADGQALDWEWNIQQATRQSIPISSHSYGFTLKPDNIRSFTSDPSHGENHGFLSLTIQLQIIGNKIEVDLAPAVH
jgi:hypothetical protein